MVAVHHRPALPDRPRLQRRDAHHEGSFRGPQAAHLKALAHGLVALASHECFPETSPPRPRLFDSTRAFLGRLAEHRNQINNTPGHSVAECPGCQGVLVVRAFTLRCRNQARDRGDGTTEVVLDRVLETLDTAFAR